MGKIIAVTSDQHAVSTMGLAPPHVTLDDGGAYRLSDTQRFLWRSWVGFWDEVEGLQQQTGYPIMAVFNGDLAEIDAKNRTHQVITRNKATALGIVRSVIERPVQLADWALFIRGTTAHVGRSAWMEELAGDYDNTIRTDKGNSSWWHWRGWVDNLLLDFQHAVRLGGKEETRGNALPGLALEIERDAYRERQPIPHLAIRAHGHHFHDTGDNYPVRVIANAAFQGITEYIYKKPYAGKPHIGGLIIVTGDKWEIHKRRFPMPKEKIQVLPKPNGKTT